jgi:hypothetical protein
MELSSTSMSQRTRSNLLKILSATSFAVAQTVLWYGAPVIAAPPDKFTDPSNYPATWPSTWYPYKINGGNLRDDTGDGTTGGTSPQQSSNISPCTGQTASTYFVRDTNNLYFRICLADNPYQSNNGPFDSSTTWSILIDVTGDGYRDFVVTLDGKGGSGDQAPDNLYVLYKNDLRQDFLDADVDFGSGSAVLWVQDSAKGTNNPANTTDGNETSWDISPPSGKPSTYSQDFKRTRITKNSDNTYFLDIQVPLSAFDAGSGGPKITSTSPMALAFATANSNTNPIQKDFTAVGTFTVDPTKPIPFGDPVGTNNETFDQPSIPTIGVGGTACSARTLTAQVQDAIMYNGTNFVSSVNSVKFYYQRDTDGNGLPDYTGSWTEIGSGAISDSTNQSLWTFSNWNTSGLLTGKYFIKAIATDTATGTPSTFNTTDSTDTADDTNQTNRVGDTYNPATSVSGAVYQTFDNTCGVAGATISGKVFDDANTNQTLDSGESGLSNVTVVLRNTTANTCQSVKTNASGNYSFTDLLAGNYEMIEAANESTPTPSTCTAAAGKTLAQTIGKDPTGYGSTTPNVLSRSITAGSTTTDLNFGDHSAQNLVSCPAPAYMIQGDSTSTLRLYSVNLANGTLTDLSGANLAHSINAIGMNQSDGFIYGVNRSFSALQE